MRHLVASATDTVEEDFAALQRTLAASPVLNRLEAPDATVFWGQLPLVAVNVIADARIADEDVARRVPELLKPFKERGLPFQWLTTPATTTPALEAALAQSGLRAQEYPAMYTSLRNPIDPGTPADVYIDIVWPDQVAPVNAAVFNDFGHPAHVAETHLDILETMDPETNHFFLARSLSNGQALGASTMHTRGDSVMLASITTVPAARGRGLERALAGTMMNRGASTGATSATLVANPSSYPTYVDLGFRTQFNVVTWIWQPEH